MNDHAIKVVIADDDPEDLELIADAILDAEPKAELFKFDDGLSAYEHLRTVDDGQVPDLIVLDYNMPRLTGAQVLANIAKTDRYKPIPKIVLSTSSTPFYKHECIRNGATEYYVKPDSLKEMYDLARAMIALGKS